MDSKDRKNVSIYQSVFEKLKKQYSLERSQSPVEINLTQWVSAKLNMVLERDLWIKETYPSLTFVGIDKTGIVIRDSNMKDQIFEVSLKDDYLHCPSCAPNERTCPHVLFAQALPEIAILEKRE